MKIYASSFRLCSQPDRFLRLFDEALRVAVVPNALDFSNDDTWRKTWISREVEDLRGLGLQPEIIDLRDHFGNAASLEQNLGAFNGVWVLGGNVFVLRRAMRQSKFDQFIWCQRAKRQGFVYGGYSAGACVLAPSLRGLELVDPPDQSAVGYEPQVCWDGLGILTYSIAPHFNSDHPESAQINSVVKYFEAEQMPYRALRDGESIVAYSDGLGFSRLC